MKAYKDRSVNYSKPVQVYRNLSRKGKVYSIKQDGLVVAHTDNFVLINVKMIVNESGRLYVVNNKRKVVHAYLEGYLSNIDSINISFSFDLNYNPFTNKYFYSELIGNVSEASVVYTQLDRLLFQL